MSSRLILTAALATAATLCWQSVSAQASAPVSREQRKAETAAANKAGQLTPAGQGTAPTTATGPSTTSRSARKAETAAANKAGQLAPAGSTQKADVADASRKPTKTREQRKAETMEARKKGELRPAGQ